MSPGANSPGLGIAATVNGVTQSTHGMEQLAQASMQSPRLTTQNPLFATMNFAPNTNNVNLNGNSLPGFNSVTINNPEATNPEVVQGMHGQGIPLVKQETEKNRTVNPTLLQTDTTNPSLGMMR